MGDEQKENKVKLILVGQPRTGKTAIYNRLLTNTYDANSMSSQTPKNQTKVVSLDTGDVEIDVWDTAGQEVFRTLNKIYYKKAVFVLLVYSIDDEKSFEELEKYWINEIKNSCPKYSIIAIVGNKADLLLEEKISEQKQKELADKNGFFSYRVSCKDGVGIEEMIIELCNEYIPKKEDIQKQMGGVVLENNNQVVEKEPFCGWFKSKKKKQNK